MNKDKRKTELKTERRKIERENNNKRHVEENDFGRAATQFQCEINRHRPARGVWPAYLLKQNSVFFARRNCSLMQLQSVTRRHEHANCGASCPPLLPAPSVPFGLSGCVHEPTEKASNARQGGKRESARRGRGLTKDDRRQRTKKRMMTHMCIYAKPETDTPRGRKGDGNGGTQWKGRKWAKRGGGRRTRLVTATEPTRIHKFPPG